MSDANGCVCQPEFRSEEALVGGSTPSPAPGPAVTAPPVPPDFIAAAHAAATALRQFSDRARTFLELRDSLKSQNLLCTPGGWSGRLFDRYITDTTGQRAAFTAAADDAMVSWGQVSNI